MLLLFLLFFNAFTSQVDSLSNDQTHHAEYKVFYRCPPCGCEQDHILFDKSGSCPNCDMPLIPVSSGIADKLDKNLGSLFIDGKFGLYYTKLIYPTFAIGILASVFLLFLRVRTRSLNIFLSLIILVLSLFGFKHQLYGVSYRLSENNQLLFTPISLIIMLGPLVFFYVKSSLIPNFKWTRKDWIHFVPAITIWLAYVLMLLIPARFQQNFLSTPYEVWFSHLEQILTVLLGFVYVTAALRFIKAEKKITHNHQSNFNWLTRFAIGSFVLFMIWGIIIFLNYWLYNFGVATITYNPLWVTFAVILMWFGAEIISRPRYFFISALANANHVDPELEITKAKLLDTMQLEKMFTDTSLTIDKLAKGIGVNAKYLSMLLNRSFGKSFYDFVNYYRVEEAKEQLVNAKNNHLTIEAVANKAGFKSKSTFNTAFKRYTNLTPREYIRQSRTNGLSNSYAIATKRRKN